MNKSNIFILALIALISLAGCATTQHQDHVVTNVKTQLVNIPDTLLEPCTITPPPDKTIYINSTIEARTQILTEYSIKLIADIQLCNNKIDKIKELQNKQRGIYTSTLEQK